MASKQETINELNEMKGFIRGSICNKELSKHYIKVLNNAVNLLEGGTIMGELSPLSKHTAKIRSLI